ncbi:MAG: DUF4476 domain-containing protein [Candidatus Stygibacter australis]|nr:DUF4476 domain-containing protein [Candidatus Stygibacter australis]
MRRYLIVLILLSVLTVFAQDQSASTGLSAKIEGNNPSSMASDSRNKAILQKLKSLEEEYLTQLPKRQYLEASMLIEEIRDMINGKSEAKTETNTQLKTTTESTQSVNVNMNISGFDNPQTPEPQSNIVVTEPATQSIQSFTAHEPMNSLSFSQLVATIENEDFAEDQLLYVRTAANSHYFSVIQIEQLLDIFTSAEHKLACLRITYPKVVDKDNSFRIISHFTYEDDKKTAQSIINQ